jgi:hypothetical protein
VPRVQWDWKAEQLEFVSKPIGESAGLKGDLQSFGARRRNILAIAPGPEVRWFFENPPGLKLSDGPFPKPARVGRPIANKIRT